MFPLTRVRFGVPVFDPQPFGVRPRSIEPVEPLALRMASVPVLASSIASCGVLPRATCPGFSTWGVELATWGADGQNEE